MTFFNKKEEVLEVKLSSYGKQKLAAGNFKPTYYAFFDDDILYDGSRAGLTEDNNNIEPRIQEHTPSLRVQTSFTDLERRVMLQTHELGADGVFHESNVMDLKTDPDVFKDYDGLRNVLPLGNSQLSNQYIAAWRIEFLANNFKNFRSTTRDPDTTCTSPFKCQEPIINIPQINVDMNVQPILTQKDFTGLVDPETGRYANIGYDGRFIRIVDDYILLDVQELNVDLLNDSFSLEVYEVITDPITLQKKLQSKMFIKEIERIVDGIMLDDEEIDAQITNAEPDQRFAEYYFNISMDDNIDNKTKFEKIVARDMKGNIFDNNVGYEEYSQTPGSELYTSDNDGGEC